MRPIPSSCVEGEVKQSQSQGVLPAAGATFLGWGLGTERGSFSLLCSSALVKWSLRVWSQHWLNLGGFKNTTFFTDNWEWPHYWGHQAFYGPLGSHMEQCHCQSQGELPTALLCSWAWGLSRETLIHVIRTGVKLSVVAWTPHFPLHLHCTALEGINPGSFLKKRHSST